MFSLHKCIYYNVRNETLRDALLFVWCIIRVFVAAAIIAIPLLLLLYLVAKYIIIPAVMIVCCFIPWIIEGCKQQ